MIIGERLREIRELQNLSQGDIESRTGLLRSYVSRVENGRTIPSVKTLEKMAHAMEMQLYQILYEANVSSAPDNNRLDRSVWGGSGQSARYFRKLTECLSRMSSADRLFVFEMAEKAAKLRRRATARVWGANRRC